jgi:hypothetical protein
MEPLVDDAIAHIGTFLSLTDLVAFRQTHPRIRRVCTALYDQHTQVRCLLPEGGVCAVTFIQYSDAKMPKRQ